MSMPAGNSSMLWMLQWGCIDQSIWWTTQDAKRQCSTASFPNGRHQDDMAPIVRSDVFMCILYYLLSPGSLLQISTAWQQEKLALMQLIKWSNVMYSTSLDVISSTSCLQGDHSFSVATQEGRNSLGTDNEFKESAAVTLHSLHVRSDWRAWSNIVMPSDVYSFCERSFHIKPLVWRCLTAIYSHDVGNLNWALSNL